MDQWKYKRKNKNNIDGYFRDLRGFLTNLIRDIDSVNESIAKLDQLSTDPRFDELAKLAAKKIIIYQANSNARTWREAAKRSTQGKRVYQYLKKEMNQREPFQNLIDESANYIKTLPQNIATRIVKRVSRLTLEGKRASEIAIDIKRYFPEATKASATLIARTQVAKTYAAITQTRAQSVGVNCYIWHDVGGPRVRRSHKHMNNVIVFYNEAPSPELLIGKKSQGYYHAGGIYNCRCWQEPIIDLKDVTWPHKVYHSGKIQQMSKKQFTKILGRLYYGTD